MTAEAPSEPIVTTYDEVPYKSYPYYQTHPEHLAVVATLFGAKTPPPDRCRVLELGCASGGNLIPMALQLPDSAFLGIDLSKRQISEGQEAIHALGLQNVELRHASILDVDESWGRFDYILCHGVFSWVPSEVREKTLDVCSANLSPTGVAFVSYNTYPGWHLRGMVREMMRYHTARFKDPKTQIQQARALLDFLASSAPDGDGPYGKVLEQERELLQKVPDSYIYHDHLEESNRPFYFEDFMTQAGERGLQYLGESQVNSMASFRFTKETQEILRRVSNNLLQTEQYMDFLRNRAFRQTLLCHSHVVLDRTLKPEIVKQFRIGAPLRRDSKTGEFRNVLGKTFNPTNPVTSAALIELSEIWPSHLPFDELTNLVQHRVQDDAASLSLLLLRTYLSSSSIVEFKLLPPSFTTAISDLPTASAVARLQAKADREVTNLRHEPVRLNDLDRVAIVLLDGTRDVSALATEFAKLVERGTLVPKSAMSSSEAGQLAVGETLRRLARLALLSA